MKAFSTLAIFFVAFASIVLASPVNEALARSERQDAKMFEAREIQEGNLPSQI
ncbi:hypothetical protein EIP91_007376 [Steccherinum ochraceum]|uniref:Uncharacterized protein n=1 Tax=Steccherinum ochraceum TaxID=92696 RepID=A0A4R0RZ24_9APHY|nr:hypothetical protein EIP91_007376 [Steccherinum ochraceum]